MRNKKLFKSAAVITAVMLSVSGCAGGCSKQTEPVIADATVETPEPEESIESTEPTPSPTVEPTEEPVEESSESEIDTPETEENTENTSESTGIEIVEELDLQMFVQTSANARSGDSTDYEVVTTFSINTELHVTGRTSNDWYRVEWGDGVVYIASNLLGDKAPSTQQPSSGSGSGGGTTTTPSSGGSGGGTPPAGDESFDPGAIGLPEWGAGGVGSGGGTGLNWTTD